MTKARGPGSVLLTMSIVGGLVAVLGRFAYSAYVIVRAGESLSSIPPGPLLLDVMQLHWFALYGVAAGAVLGVVFIVTDIVRAGGGDRQVTPASGEELNPLAEDKVKAQRMALGERFLDEADQEDGGDKSP